MPNEQEALLKKFNKMLVDYPDNADSASYFVSFLRLFLRQKPSSSYLPTIEIMTIIKHEKPTVFFMMRKLAKYDFNLELLTGLHMDYEKARENLQNQLKKPRNQSSTF
ncbi:hypothetical protein [Bacillus sp. V5-8f]|uniref:hypothetical protein n=1 Tax=Bacillus sp. V5-8f TaxID=2053044 RepID=UPI000C771359|nr:hypothetical protein [Bacillus sp. V5-8f]PLT35789.1 hypothetical protein CUU64_00500 [Bacillus sp. V5-8f]